MASEIRVDKITSLSGVGTITPSSSGIDITGITTVATLKATTGIVTTLTATTGIVTTLTANTVTSLGAVSGTTGTFSGAVSGTTGTFSGAVSGTTGTFTGNITASSSNIKTGDSSSSTNNRLQLGAATYGDLELYHDGTSSYIDNATNDLFIRNTGDDITIQAADDITIAVQGGENAIVAYGDGAVELYHNNTKQCETNSTGLAFPSGKGISFAATADSGGTMANELFDDYEEGTWTPKLAPGTSYASIHNNGTGRYTKIGNMVHCVMGWFDEDCTAFPTNEQIMIYNFPFTIVHVANTADAHYIAPFLMAYNVQFGNDEKHYFYSNHNATTARGLKSRDGLGWQIWSTSDWNQSGLYFDTHMTYMTTS